MGNRKYRHLLEIKYYILGITIIVIIIIIIIIGSLHLKQSKI